MIISAKLIKKPRVIRKCYACYLKITGIQLRLYGAAHSIDKPYTIYVHPECCKDVKNKKIRKVLNGYKNSKNR